MGPYKTTPSHLVLTQEEAEYNVRTSGVRIAVEQLFGLVLNKWAYNGYQYGLRHSSCRRLYGVGSVDKTL
ncbi:hypothetical protein LIPSTDRAFT_71760 [Lipomyces starkeyi NRRL Y-11557]|uniref:DDE Tnp4 domain-containing protein n=1 Tax=Lipomyces starkeyi NRRL Y-11557 TaxID=675824 RepID=A0A1E3Q8N7_LIPST|nr:hypothetical protein LIPSTDRAFT_71760 [Lipomyces starkeyi NRRL Y-11557]